MRERCLLKTCWRSRMSSSRSWWKMSIRWRHAWRLRRPWRSCYRWRPWISSAGSSRWTIRRFGHLTSGRSIWWLWRAKRPGWHLVMRLWGSVHSRWSFKSIHSGYGKNNYFFFKTNYKRDFSRHVVFQVMTLTVVLVAPSGAQEVPLVSVEFVGMEVVALLQFAF